MLFRSNIADTGNSMDSFFLSVIAFVFINSSKWFLYNLVDINQLWKRSEPLAKQYEASSKNGVVGKIGSATPRAPNPRKRNPRTIYIIFKILDFTK